MDTHKREEADLMALSAPSRQPGDSRGPLDRLFDSDEVAKRAYLIWQANGCYSGNEIYNWAQAQKKIFFEKLLVKESAR